MCYSGLHVEVLTLHRSQLINLTNIILPFGQADSGAKGWGRKGRLVGSVPWSNPLPFYIILPFLTEKVPLSDTFY